MPCLRKAPPAAKIMACHCVILRRQRGLLGQPLPLRTYISGSFGATPNPTNGVARHRQAPPGVTLWDWLSWAYGPSADDPGRTTANQKPAVDLKTTMDRALREVCLRCSWAAGGRFGSCDRGIRSWRDSVWTVERKWRRQLPSRLGDTPVADIVDGEAMAFAGRQARTSQHRSGELGRTGRSPLQRKWEGRDGVVSSLRMALTSAPYHKGHEETLRPR